MVVRFFLAGVLFAAMPAATALAQVPATYRCLDEGGRSTYTNVKEEMAGKQCTLVSREVSVVPAQAPPPRTPQPGARASSPAPNAAAKANAASSRATERRRILMEELSDEEKRLAEARQKLADQQAVRQGDERNYQRVLDRLKPYVDAVEQHERNITQLRRELGGNAR
jgi:hypothetical protein